MSGKSVSKKKKKQKPPPGDENISVVSLLNQLKNADTLPDIEAALAKAKASGFSNKHETYKHAKRRLFALQTGEALEDLLAKEGAKKRKRSFDEDIAELETRAVACKNHTESVSDETVPTELHAKQKQKKRRKEKKNGVEESKGPREEKANEQAKELGSGLVDPHKRKPKEFQVRISGFPFSEDEESLRKYFCSYGEISEVELVKDKAERSRAIAFITFASEEGCSAALEGNGHEYKRRYLKISKPANLSHQASKKRENVNDSEFKIIIAGLPYTTEPDRVQRKFAKCGEIESFYMPVNRAGSKRGQSKGFALITYKTQEAMDMALSHNGDVWLGNTLVVTRKSAVAKNAQDVSAATEVTSREFEVFVGGLYSIGRKVIKKHFMECGEIESFEMPLTREGESRGIAFIAYKTREGMDNALRLHESQLGKRWLTVERKAEKKA